MCGEVAKSSNRNSLGVLSSFIADSTNVTRVIDSAHPSLAVNTTKNVNTDLLVPNAPEIREVYKWPKNAIVPRNVRYEENIYDQNFTESGFPIVELNKLL